MRSPSRKPSPAPYSEAANCPVSPLVYPGLFLTNFLILFLKVLYLPRVFEEWTELLMRVFYL